MNQRHNPTAIDQAIERCDRLLEDIDQIQRDMRAACEKANAALQDAIEKLSQPRTP